MPTLEIVDVPMEDVSSDEHSKNLQEDPSPPTSDAQAITAAPTTITSLTTSTVEEGKSESASSKKRKITPNPSKSSAKKTKAKVSKGQLTLGSFFGGAVNKSSRSSQITPLANNSCKTPAAEESTTKASSSDQETTTTTTTTASKTSSSSKLTTTKTTDLDPLRKSKLLSIVVGKSASRKSATPKSDTKIAASDTVKSTRPVQLLEKFEDKGIKTTSTTNKDAMDKVTNEYVESTEPNDKEKSTNEKTAVAENFCKELLVNHGETPVVTAANSTEPPAESAASLLDAIQEECAKTSDSCTTEPSCNEIDTSRPITTTTLATESSSVKEQNENKNPAFVDYASSKLKLEPGTRLQVQWLVDSENDDIAATRWWGASLEAFDGRSTPDGHAIRVLEYDAYPEGGFENKSREEVIFKTKSGLRCVESGVELNFRREAASGSPESSTPIKSVSKKTSPAPKGTPVEKPLSDKAMSWVEKSARMQETYMERAKELLEECREKLPEEDFEIPLPADTTMPTVEDGNFDSFPDFAVPVLVCLVEGKTEPLSTLATSITDKLNQVFNTTKFTLSMTTAKIKIVATRKNMVKHPFVVDGSSAVKLHNLFEDACADYMWRWEVAVLELLPGSALPKIKRARAARKKPSYYLNAVTKLIQTIVESQKHLQSDSKLDKAIAKVSQEEERVLKYARDEEKQRLAKQKKQEAKVQKEEDSKTKQLQEEGRKREKEQKKLELAQEKQRKKEEAAREKQQKKEEAAREKQRKKEEAAEMKKQKEDEKAAAEQKAKEKKRAVLEKQRKKMMSFLSAPPAQKSSPGRETSTEAATEVTKVADYDKLEQSIELESEFDSSAFRSTINAVNDAHSTRRPFSSLSSKARKSRRRRTQTVTVPVFVTVFPDNPFEVQPFAEQKDVTVLNKYKFFLFHEDVRPPYHGTWSKRSDTVTGRNPFQKDSSGRLDYDIDSEAEWEEGDDEVGEDIENEAGDEEEEKDEEGSLDEDGWLAADDEVDEDMDEETKALRKKQLEATCEADKQIRELTVCIVGPCAGRPAFLSTGDVESEFLDGLSTDEAKKSMETFIVEKFSNEDVFLDAFPPALVDEATGASDNVDGNVMTQDDKKAFVKFVHNSTVKSKEKLVDALQSNNPAMTMSRAAALRMLDSVAEKKKGHIVGTMWQVKADVLSSLGLGDLETVNASEVRQDARRAVALACHHSMATSKDKLVDEIRKADENLKGLSKAEIVRVVEDVVDKKKHPVAGVYWEVKSDTRDELGLCHLSSVPPTVSEDATTVMDPSCHATVQTDANEAGRISGTNTLTPEIPNKKRKAPPAASAKVLASFLKKKKVTTPTTAQGSV